MTHEDRVWHHEMETLEGIHEHAERIASLEELVLDMWKGAVMRMDFAERYAFIGEFADRMRELGLEAK